MTDLKKMNTQLIYILHTIMPSYSIDYWQANIKLFGAVPEFDSMAIVTLIEELENEFDIEFNDEDITEDNFLTINTLITLIEKYLHDKNIS